MIFPKTPRTTQTALHPKPEPLLRDMREALLFYLKQSAIPLSTFLRAQTLVVRAGVNSRLDHHDRFREGTRLLLRLHGLDRTALHTLPRRETPLNLHDLHSEGVPGEETMRKRTRTSGRGMIAGGRSHNASDNNRTYHDGSWSQ